MAGAWALLLLAVYVVAEWWVASWFAGIVGWAGVLVTVGLSIVFGVAIMRRAGFAAARSLMPVQAGGVTVVQQPDAQRVGREVGDAGLVFVAGALVAVPGLITTALGLLLLIPPVRRLVARQVSRRVRRRAERAGVVFEARTVQGGTVQGTVVREDLSPRGEILQGEVLPPDNPGVDRE
jgi:UPF0716 protein FxsA